MVQYWEVDLAVGENNDVYITGTTRRFAAGESLDFGGQVVKAGGGEDASLPNTIRQVRSFGLKH